MAEKPLSNWNFTGELRKSQRAIIDATKDQLGTGDPLHIVAPPGSGKTLLGLMLAKMQGDKTLVLAPTTTIRSQWVKQARELAQNPGAVSEDPKNIADLTVLTYQMLSVVDRANPFEDLAKKMWVTEFLESGRTQENAEAWLENLAETNKKAYRQGIVKRSQKVRRELVRQDPAEVEATLHPNARALIDALEAAGVTTIVLDECHHLLDHWALVIRALVNRLSLSGKTVTLIGLTATLPSLDDKDEYENYNGLLGEVDYELPTPAVVKEGNLAPYKNLVWFVEPSAAEQAFLKRQGDALRELTHEMLTGKAGLNFIEKILTPALDANKPWTPSGSPRETDKRLADAFSKDFALAEAFSQMLWSLEPQHHIVSRMPKALKRDPDTESNIRVLARFALEEILPDPARSKDWERTRKILADFGFLLTDKGIRKGRDPVDNILATTISKELAIGEILTLEMGALKKDRLRAVVVCDFATHGHGAGQRTDSAGALRTFETVVRDPRLNGLCPVLVTAKHLRIAKRDYDYLVPKLESIFGTPELNHVGLASAGETVELKFQKVGPAKTVKAVSKLLTEGVVNLIVGTRGLLGEGWDAPALNTLIDLTAVGTSSSTQQLYGRTIRIDPAWPQKVAHNWTVTAVLDKSSNISGDGDIKRMLRKLDHLWGVSLQSSQTIVKGATHTFSNDQLIELGKILDADKKASAQKINAKTRESFPDRALTYQLWDVGGKFRSKTSQRVKVEKVARSKAFGTGLTLEAIMLGLFSILATSSFITFRGITEGQVRSLPALLLFFLLTLLIIAIAMRKDIWRLVKSVKHFALPMKDYQGAVLAVADGLKTRGVPEKLDISNIQIEPLHEFNNKKTSSYLISVPELEETQQHLILSNLDELFGEVRTPRFLLEVGVLDFSWGNLMGWNIARVLKLFGFKSRFFAVPTLIGRRKADAQRFFQTWQKKVGPAKLHEIQTQDDMELLMRARRLTAPVEEPTKHRFSRFTVWS